MLAKLAKRKDIESYVVTAIPVGAAGVFIAFNVVDRDGTFIGSAVIEVDIATMAAKLVYESELSLIDYVVGPDHWQCLLLTNRVVEIEPGGKPVETAKKVPDGLYRMSALGDRRVMVCGDSGRVVMYAKRKFTNLAVDTGAADPKYQEDLRSIHYRSPVRGYAVGNYGTVLKGDTKELSPVARKKNPFGYFEKGSTRERRAPVLAVYENASGSVLLGSDGGPQLVYDKTFTKLSGLGPDAKVVAMVEFKGKEYWSADDNTLYIRKGTKLRKCPEEAGGYRMEANEYVLASSCGSFVYFFDDKRWTRVRVNPNPKKLVERLKLDF